MGDVRSVRQGRAAEAELESAVVRQAEHRKRVREETKAAREAGNRSRSAVGFHPGSQHPSDTPQWLRSEGAPLF